MLGARQGDRSRRHSSRFPACICFGSTESDADHATVRKELRRRRDQVRSVGLKSLSRGQSWQGLLGYMRVCHLLCCSLSVVVEDVSSSCCVTVKVFPYMTVAALKQQVRQLSLNNCIVAPVAPLTPSPLFQVFLEYGFHPRVQRWVIGQCLCTEPRSLASYGVQKDGDTAYLYLISARQARITRQLFQQDLENALLAPPLPPGNGPTSQDWRGYNTLPSRLPHNNQG